VIETSAIYVGVVLHQRFRPRRHRLRYRVFSLLLDIDELPQLGSHLRLFGYNRWSLVSFLDRDHGDGSGGKLRPWVETQMVAAGLAPDGGRITILCYPRILGYVFNPLTVYFCHGRQGGLVAILYEVSNRHGERHTYVIPVTDPFAATVHQTCRKQFYVSPFIPMNCTYRFQVLPPRERASVGIEEFDEVGPLLTATFSGRRRPLGDGALLRALAAYPLLTLKVTAGIHWEALRLLLKGMPLFVHHRAEQRIGVSIVDPLEHHRTGPRR
jgi:DUF1365 family protein